MPISIFFFADTKVYQRRLGTCVAADLRLAGLSFRKDRAEKAADHDAVENDEVGGAGKCRAVIGLLDYKKPDSDNNLRLNGSATFNEEDEEDDLPGYLFILSLTRFDLQTPLIHLMHVACALHVSQNVVLQFWDWL